MENHSTSVRFRLGVLLSSLSPLAVRATKQPLSAHAAQSHTTQSLDSPSNTGSSDCLNSNYPYGLNHMNLRLKIKNRSDIARLCYNGRIYSSIILITFFCIFSHRITLDNMVYRTTLRPTVFRNVIKKNSLSPDVCVAGIVRNAFNIQPSIWRSLYEMNCIQSYAVHMIIGDDVESAMKYKDQLWTKWNSDEEKYIKESPCAPFTILHESTNHQPNRIDKISWLRDRQRLLLRQYFGAKLSDSSIIILLDFDLVSLPDTTELVQAVNLLCDPNYQHDAICAAGVSFGWWYFDTFATVLLPDTFVHPLSRRLFPAFYAGENAQLVRSNNQFFGAFTQADLMRYLLQEGQQSTTGRVSVRSCFGGLAIYKASMYLSNDCQYILPPDLVAQGNSSTIMKYASSKDERPCEHVVLHNCLKRSLTRFDIALDPNLVTKWRKD